MSTKSKRETQTQATLKAVELVQKNQITNAVKKATASADAILANHPTPTGQDCKTMRTLATSRDFAARVMGALDWTASEYVRNLFDFHNVYKPERKSVNAYLPLKSFPKLDALCCAMLLGDGAVMPNVSKYLTSILALSEATNQSEIANGDVYALYCSNQTRVNAILDAIDNVEMRAIMKNRELWKSPSTAVTQRPTSAWLLHLVGAGSNNGNSKTITVDRSSDAYKTLCALFLS